MTVRRRNHRLALGRALHGTILIGIWTLVMPLPTTAQESEESILLGSVTRAEIEAAIPDWVSEAMASELDLEAADRLLQAIDGAEVVVYLGSWCDDTRRELGRFWWALDSLGVDGPSQVTYVAVDRSLTEPADQVAGVGLIRVPTFVVRRGGAEQGRIVEESPNGIEIDLLGLLLGEVSGTITASEDLWIEETDSQP